MTQPSSDKEEMYRQAEREALPLRAEIASLGVRGRTTPYPMAVREKILEYAGRWRVHGLSWKRIGRYVGLSGWAVERWWRLSTGRKSAQRKTVALLPVQVKPDKPAAVTRLEPSSLSVVSPGGYRVEGLVLSEVVQLLRALP